MCSRLGERSKTVDSWWIWANGLNWDSALYWNERNTIVLHYNCFLNYFMSITTTYYKSSPMEPWCGCGKPLLAPLEPLRTDFTGESVGTKIVRPLRAPPQLSVWQRNRSPRRRLVGLCRGFLKLAKLTMTTNLYFCQMSSNWKCSDDKTQSSLSHCFSI